MVHWVKIRMISLLRIVPALRQLVDVTVVRSWSYSPVTTLTKCHYLSTSAACFSSENEKTDGNGSKGTVDIIADNGDFEKRSPERNDDLHVVRKVKRNKPVKLHRRTLTKEEMEADALLEKKIGSLRRDDLFGNLSKGVKSLTPSRCLPQYRSRHLHAETGKQNWTNSELSEVNTHQRSKRRSSGLNSSKDQGDHPSSKAWVNTFGTLEKDLNGREICDDLETEESVASEEEYFSSEDEEERPYRRLTDHGRYSANWYGRQMRDFDRQGKVKEAIDVLDVWMLKNDRVRPNYYVFSMLISILGRAGYTKKAFQVFNQMKKMGIRPKDNTYTALFNACSNSPWPHDGLRRARNLHSLLVEKGHRPNLITYRSMIKAYGVCGDLRAAFSLLDEASQRFTPDHRCFSFLLMACCSNREAGFRHAVMVWRLMRQHGLKPDLYLYNLLLRAIRDCGIGDPNTAGQLIHNSTAPQKQLNSSQRSSENVLQEGIVQVVRQTQNKTFIEAAGDNKRVDEISNLNYGRSNNSLVKEHVDDSSQSDLRIEKKGQSEIDIHVSSLEEVRPSVLSLNLPDFAPVLPSILDHPLNNESSSIVRVNLDLLGTAEARLALVGGMNGILKNMEDDDITPDIKTLSQLVNCIPDNAKAEGELIQSLTDKKIQPDVDFFNMVIRKRNLRRDYVGAKELLAVIGEYKLLPNMTTFGCLAMGCSRRADGLQLLRDMQAYGLTPNQAIFTILVYNSSDDFHYKLSLLKEMRALDILPTEKMLMYIEKRLQISKQAILDQERGLEVSNYYKKDHFHRGYKKFLEFYGDWLRSTPVDKGEHPWARFRQPRQKAEASPTEHEEDESFVRTV